MIIPCEYDSINVRDTLGYIAVCKGVEWYYINSGNERCYNIFNIFNRLPLFGGFICYLYGLLKQANYGSKSF